MTRKETPLKKGALCTPLSCGFNDQLKHFLDIRGCISISVHVAFKDKFGQVEDMLVIGIGHY